VVDKYAGTRNYITARRSVISAREGKVKNIYPVEKLALRALIRDYQNLVDEVGLNPNTLEAYRSKALLHAFYLDEKDTAINILKEIINTPRAQADTKSKSKIDLGDIYLLKGEPWEATLLYSQVEKSNKDSRIGYDAKLKNAKLNYYKGEFELSKSHLDILKLATSREIANDAISLSLLIKDNTVLDTSDFVTKEFAGIDLLLFQNKDSAAVEALNSMLKKYPGHSLTDEIYWRLANINLQQANFETALAQLEQIQKNYADDILGDDAMYLFAKVHEESLLKLQLAMEIYNQFLLKYPGSVFTADARKRFRKLRGDEVY
jgi:outer membrane protein assembly factor BamD (BamD/ComL family)